VPRRQELSAEALEPVCLLCGNRCLFVVKTEEGYAVISTMGLMALPDLTSARCGRCRGHNCITIDYDG
jgi:hypothetical protein